MMPLNAALLSLCRVGCSCCGSVIAMLDQGKGFVVSAGVSGDGCCWLLQVVAVCLNVGPRGGLGAAGLLGPGFFCKRQMSASVAISLVCWLSCPYKHAILSA